MNKQRAIKKVQIAINKMVDLQDAGYGCDTVSRILEKLNTLEDRIENNRLELIAYPSPTRRKECYLNQ